MAVILIILLLAVSEGYAGETVTFYGGASYGTYKTGTFDVWYESDPDTVFTQSSFYLGMRGHVSTLWSLGFDVGYTTVDLTQEEYLHTDFWGRSESYPYARDQGSSVSFTPAVYVKTSDTAIVCAEFGLGLTVQSFDYVRLNGTKYSVNEISPHIAAYALIQTRSILRVRIGCGYLNGVMAFTANFGVAF